MVDLDALIRDADPARDLVIPDPDPGDADRLSRESKPSPGRTDALWAAIGVVAVLAVAAIALTAGGDRHGSATRSTPVPPATGPLFSILGVLRRPQTSADRGAAAELADQSGAQRARIERRIAAAERQLAAKGIHGGAVRKELMHLRAQLSPAAPDPQVRLAAVTSWGEQLILVPYRSGSTEEVCLDSGNGAGDCGLTAGVIDTGRAWSLEGAGRDFAGGSTATRLFIIVPDGVSKVAFVLPRQGSVPGGPIYPNSQSVVAPVHNNIAFAQVNRQCCDGNLVTRWYAADGRLIKATGNPVANNEISGPRPTPETPISRAAERNPSTPNPVDVTPRSGGPTTAFKIQWRVLISDADYQITATGPNGPGCRGASDLGGIVGGGANDVRGQLYSVTVPSEGRLGSSGDRWCAGTYHVSVSLYDLGLAGGLKHPDRPFGSGTFIIKA